MKRFFLVFLSLVILLSPVMAYADLDPYFDVPTSSDELLNGDFEIESVELFSAGSPVTSSDTSGLKSVLLDLLGPYDGIVVEYKYRNPNATYDQFLREVQPDYVWIASFLMLALFIYCLFRLGGALLG